MNLHHLPVVTFDKRISEKQIVTRDPVNVRKYCPSNKISVSNAKNNREEQIGSTNLTTCQKLAKLERPPSGNVRAQVFKCKGQVHRNRIKDIERGSSASREDTSKNKKKKDGLKTKISLKHHKNKPKKIKNKFTSVMKDDNSSSHDDIKVLYAAKNVKNRKVKRRKTLCRKKLSVPYIKRPSTDVFRTGNKKLRNIYLYYQFCKNTGWLPENIKRRYSNPRIECQALPLKLGTCKTRNAVSEKILPPPEHYNVVDFSKEDDCVIPTKIVHCPRTRKDREESSSSPESAPVAAPPVRRHNKKSTSKSLTVVPEKIPLQIEQVRKVCRSVQYQNLPEMPCLSNISKKQKLATTRFFDSMRYFLKYFLLIVALIVWSPCFVVVFISWCLLSRLRPQDITPQEKLGAPGQRFKNKYHRNLVELLGVAYDKMISTFKVIKSSFDSKNIVRSSSPNKVEKSKSEVKSQPNPNKRYVLHYSSDKGWLMKPMRTEVEDRTVKRGTDKVNTGIRNKNNDDKRRRTVTFSKTPQEQTSNDRKEYVNQRVCRRCTKKPDTAAQTSPSHQVIRVCRPRPDCHRACRSASLPIVNQPRRGAGVCPPYRAISSCRNLSLRHINQPTYQRRAMRISSDTLHRLVKTYNKQASRPYKRATCVRRERKVSREKPSRKQKFYMAVKKHAVNLRDRYAEAQAKSYVDCNKVFANNLRNRPMSAYFLEGYNLCKNTCSFCLFMLSSLVWLPVFLCCYLSFWLMCQCCN